MRLHGYPVTAADDLKRYPILTQWGRLEDVGGSGLELRMLWGPGVLFNLYLQLLHIFHQPKAFYFVITCRQPRRREVHCFLKEAALVEFRMPAGRLLNIFGCETENSFAPVCVLLNSMPLSFRFNDCGLLYDLRMQCSLDMTACSEICKTRTTSLSWSRSFRFYQPSLFSRRVTLSLFVRFQSWATAALDIVEQRFYTFSIWLSSGFNAKRLDH